MVRLTVVLGDVVVRSLSAAALADPAVTFSLVPLTVVLRLLGSVFGLAAASCAVGTDEAAAGTRDATLLSASSELSTLLLLLRDMLMT